MDCHCDDVFLESSREIKSTYFIITHLINIIGDVIIVALISFHKADKEFTNQDILFLYNYTTWSQIPGKAGE